MRRHLRLCANHFKLFVNDNVSLKGFRGAEFLSCALILMVDFCVYVQMVITEEMKCVAAD